MRTALLRRIPVSASKRLLTRRQLAPDANEQTQTKPDIGWVCPQDGRMYRRQLVNEVEQRPGNVAQAKLGPVENQKGPLVEVVLRVRDPGVKHEVPRKDVER